MNTSQKHKRKAFYFDSLVQGFLELLDTLPFFTQTKPIPPLTTQAKNKTQALSPYYPFSSKKSEDYKKDLHFPSASKISISSQIHGED